MTDRELLKLAAKEAGIASDRLSDRYDQWDKDHAPVLVERAWDPLNDDGDALRLAVTLGLFNLGELLFRYGNDPLIDTGKDKYAAIRRAIVMAAADV